MIIMKDQLIKRGAAVLVTMGVVAAVTIAGAGDMGDGAGELEGLIWSDEFDGDSLNRDYWNVEVNGYGGWNNELQFYLDNPDTVSVSDGTLKIRASKVKFWNKPYSSARLNTDGKVSLDFSRIEARMKLPCFMGAWPAFWLMGTNGQEWPACGEIDVVETINDEGIVYGSAHWPSLSPGKQNDSVSGGTQGYDIDITDWHVYGIERDEEKIIWYVDDHKYSSAYLNDNALKAPLSGEQYVLLNLAIGGNWPGFKIDDTALPATLEVDYVRAYK